MTELTAEQAYLQTLLDHIKYVKKAGSIHFDLPWSILNIHDQSKFSREEFFPYAHYFFNENGTNKNPEDRSDMVIYDFNIAWLHHLHHNNHHWQYWIFPDEYSNEKLVDMDIMTESGVFKMHGIAVLEMLADWMGASKAYTGSWDLSEWLKSNMPRITVHPYTAEEIRIKLIDVDYKYRTIVDNTPFKHEI